MSGMPPGIPPAPWYSFVNWVTNSLHFLLFLSEFLYFGQLVGIQPFDSFITLVVDGLHVVSRDLVLNFLVLNCSLHVKAVRLQTILGRNSFLLLLVISLELLGIIYHPLNFFL